MIALLRNVYETYENLFADYPAGMYWLSRF